jgi:hypothetical protein
MYVGYTNSFSVHFFCTIEFLCMWVEQNIRNVNILLTCADDRNDDETSTFMDRGKGNAIKSRAGAWLNGLSGGIAVPLAIALWSLLDKDGS